MCPAWLLAAKTRNMHPKLNFFFNTFDTHPSHRHVSDMHGPCLFVPDPSWAETHLGELFSLVIDEGDFRRGSIGLGGNPFRVAWSHSGFHNGRRQRAAAPGRRGGIWGFSVGGLGKSGQCSSAAARQRSSSNSSERTHAGQAGRVAVALRTCEADMPMPVQASDTRCFCDTCGRGTN